MTIKKFMWDFTLASCILIVGYLSMSMIIWFTQDTFSQSQGILQTDYKDIGSRQKIDRDLWGSIEVLNKQTQVDTVVFSGGNTADTIYLDLKYSDTDYIILLLYRKEIGTQNTDMPYAYPLSDSSFIIESIHTDDVSVVQWMSIHK